MRSLFNCQILETIYQMIGNSNSQWKTTLEDLLKKTFDNSKCLLMSQKLGVGQACASLAPETPACEPARYVLFRRILERRSALLQPNELQTDPQIVEVTGCVFSIGISGSSTWL